MNMPKMYAPVNIRFSSLRNAIGSSGGVIFDVDTMVERKVRRISYEGGWKFQIINADKIREWDWFVDTDQEVLNEIGMDIRFIEFNNLRRGK